MQTFLPYADFAATAACLDDRRLGKQRVEALQILKALCDPAYGWQRHPAVRMWRGHAGALKRYARAICREWRRRGFNDSVDCQLRAFRRLPGHRPYRNPPWLGDPAFHAAHRSNLLRKNSAHYRQFGWTDPPDLPYIWPS